MKFISLFIAAASIAVGPATVSCASPAYAASGFAGCCKVCKKGKACGDSCIARDKECHKGKGCACDG
jgi:hypothetical protein